MSMSSYDESATWDDVPTTPRSSSSWDSSANSVADSDLGWESALEAEQGTDPLAVPPVTSPFPVTVPSPRDWSKYVFIVTAVASVAGAVATYAALNSINVLSPQPLGDFADYMRLSVLCGGILLLGVFFSVAWGALRRPKKFAAGTIAVALLATPALAYVAVTEGVVAFQENTGAALVGNSGQGIVKIQEIAKEHDVDLGVIGRVIDAIASRALGD
jgi:hypothetical protein